MYYIKLYFEVKEDNKVIGIENDVSHNMGYEEAYELVNKFREEKKEFEVIDEDGNNVNHKF